MKIMLLPNVEGYGVLSMQRYHAELALALPTVAPAAWSFESMRVETAPHLGPTWGGRTARLLTYPRRLRQARADVFHILDHSHAHLARSTPPSRTVMTFHDCIPLLAGLGLIDVPVAWRARRGFPARIRHASRCARVITDSEATRQNLIALGHLDPGRVTTIPLGVSKVFSPLPPDGRLPSEERSDVLRQYALPEDCLLLAHVGTPGRYKNVPGLLKVLRALLDDASLGPRVHLIRVGAAFTDDEQDQVQALELGGRITAAGHVPGDAALARIYRAADLLLFPSLWEGFGWPPLEAMACGTPPVTSNAGALPEVIGDVTPMAAANDSDALAAIARMLLIQPDTYRHAIDQGLARAATFGWDDCARRVCAVYASLHE